MSLKTTFSAACLAALAASQQEKPKNWYKDHKGTLHLLVSEQNTFRVAQFTDLHFGEDEDRDAQTINMISEVIRKEEPDFIAVTGDVVSGQMYDVAEEKTFREWSGIQHRKLLDHLHGTPFAWVPGFHDLETLHAESFIADEMQNEELYASPEENKFHFMGAPIENDFNHRVMLEKSDGSGDVVGSLWFLGNGRWECLGQLGRDCIRRSQIEWFKHESRNNIPDDKFRSNGIAFMHTPLHEHLQMLNNVPTHGQHRDYTEC